MAAIMTKQGNLDNIITYEHICDTFDDIQTIDPHYITLGSTCVVINGESGGLEVYMADSNKEWQSISIASGDGGGDIGIGIHICGNDEYDSTTGEPTMEDPIENQFYLVPSSSSDSSNLFDEWIYINGNWEKFGGGSIDIPEQVQVDWNENDNAKKEYIQNKPNVINGTGLRSIIENYIEGNIASGIDSHAEGYDTHAEGDYSHAEGYGVTFQDMPVTGAINTCDHAEGYSTLADSSQDRNNSVLKRAAHAEGYRTKALSSCSHAEGSNTIVTGTCAHGEGTSSAIGDRSHSEGIYTEASGNYTHAEGNNTKASGENSHAEGQDTKASGTNSHAEGLETVASGAQSHAEGAKSYASGAYSHAEGYQTISEGTYSHSEGQDTIANGNCSHTSGLGTISNYKSQFVFGEFNESDGLINVKSYERGTYVEIVGNGKDNILRSNARTLDWDGNEWLAGNLTTDGDVSTGGDVSANTLKLNNGNTIIKGYTDNDTPVRGAIVFGNDGGIASGQNSVSYGGTASGSRSIANGPGSTASGDNSVAIGGGSTASGYTSVAIGGGSTASGRNCIAIGLGNQADGIACLALGAGNTTQNNYSIAIGGGNISNGNSSVAFGMNTIANHSCQFVFGEYNTEDNSDATAINRGAYIEIVGNGDNNTRSNARTLDWSGNEWLAGNLTLNQTTLTENDLIELLNLRTTEVTITDTDVIITANSNTRYICGEISTLDFTPSSTGICNVKFTSGSSKTILTLPSTVKMPDWFEVEANMTYEISIADGVYGVVTSWAV